MPELDIDASAREVADLLNRSQTRQAVERLDALRQGQELVLQESLDRFVAARASERLTALGAPGAIAAGDAERVDLGARREADLDRLADSMAGHMDLARLADCFGDGAAASALRAGLA